MEQPLSIPLSQECADFHRSFEAGLNHERKRLGCVHPLYINGRASRSSQKTFPDTAPADHRMELGKFQHARKDHVLKAVTAARKAFPFWRELGWEQRVAFLRKVAELMTRHQFELAALLCFEAGKTRMESANEVTDSINLIHYYCHILETQHGYRLTQSQTAGLRSYNLLEPYGVWGVIGPFDSPLAAATNMLAGTLLAGNTVVFKPSSHTPFIGLRLYDMVHQAGFPIGVVNYLTGPGAEIGLHLAQHPGIDGLLFTGSHDVGLSLYRAFNGQLPKPCILELGANNPAVVMPSANLEDAAEGIARSAYLMAGQSAAACSRVYVHSEVTHDLVECLTERLHAFVVGLPEDPETTMGPLIDESSMDAFSNAVRVARKDGKILFGGKPIRRGDLAHGNFVQPTLVQMTSKHSVLLRDEFALPILCVVSVRSIDEAITLANDSPFGLSAGIFTQVDGDQEQFFDAMKVGALFSNRTAGATSGARPGIQSLGGWKASGTNGKSPLGPYYLTQFMREQNRTICG